MESSIKCALPICLSVEGALSVSSDESEAPGQANTWHQLFELAYHHEVGAVLESWCGRLLPDCLRHACLQSMSRVSVEKFTIVSVRVISKMFCRCRQR